MSSGDPTYHQVAAQPPQPPAAPQDGAPPAEGQEQPQQMPSVFETLKSMAVRIMIFYFIMNFFKKSPQQPSTGTGDGVSKTRGPATNLYSEGMGFDLYIYISEQEEFGEFNVNHHFVEQLKTDLFVLDAGVSDLEKGRTEVRRLDSGT